jgi:1,4-alpha-glucan branching enzyme
MTTLTDDGYVEFRFFRPQASKVFLAGDFNDWRIDQLSMVRQEEGHWFLRLHLPAGDHRFRYVADGLWYTDYAAFGVEPGRFGMDSVLRVPEPRLKVHPRRPAPARAAAAA